MTDQSSAPPQRRELKKRSTTDENVRKRYGKERRFRLYGIAAVSSAIAMLGVLMFTIIGSGFSAFFQHEIALNVDIDADRLGIGSARDGDTLGKAPYLRVVREALKTDFPGVKDRQERRTLYGLVSSGADFSVRDTVLQDPSVVGTTQTVWVKASDDIDTFMKGQMTAIESWAPTGTATPTGTSGEVRVSVTTDAFAGIIADVKGWLKSLADERQGEVEELRAIIEQQKEYLTRLRANGGASQLADRTAQSIAVGENALKKLIVEADGLRARATSPGGSESLNPQLPSYLVSINGGLVKIEQVSGSEISGKTLLPLDSKADTSSGDWQIVSYVTSESDRRVKDQEIAGISALEREGRMENRFNWSFFQTGDNREPEQAGILGALVGSLFTLIITLLISFPIGVLAAIYLEEFAPKNRWTDIIEVNINNLAAVPSIVFGLLGLAVFLNVFGLPRSAPVVGGMVLALMTLPTIIIAARAALKSVPPSIRQAALGMGASRLQTVTHHVLPLAMPGILTGTIIGTAQALGEAAPLLMIGMVAFIVDVPGGFTDPATVMPVQIYLWADSPERAFVAKTSAAIMVLLAFLILMNALAVLLRKRFKRRW